MRASAWCCLQGVEHFKDIQYNEQSRYGEILLQQEYEMSCFNLEQADIDVYQQLYALYEKVGVPISSAVACSAGQYSFSA